MFGFDSSKHTGFIVDTFFFLSFVGSSFFLLFGAYNHNGDGIVMFRNPDDEAEIPDDDDRALKFRGNYVGFDMACDLQDTVVGAKAYTDCHDFDAMEDDELKILLPITWALWGLALAHFLIKRAYEHFQWFKDLAENRLFQVLSSVVLFAAPIALFIMSCIYWSDFIERSNTISGDDDYINTFNANADYYKDTSFFGGGMTLTVMFLLIAELLQALACCIVYARSVMAVKSIKGLLLGKEAFTGIRMAINAKVGASVDAAAKNPETKNTVTSIYTNRRVTNGIAF
jgi:hypothetical protein